MNFLLTARGARDIRRSAAWVICVIMAVAAIVLVVNALHLRSEGAQSAYTQAHGVQRQATVVSVDNIEQQNPGSSGQSNVPSNIAPNISYTATITATLNAPVGGQSRTTVQVPHYVSYRVGQTVTVLVDPNSPGYAELPGVPDVTPKSWYGMLVAAVICAVLACLLGWRAKVLGRRRAAQSYAPHPQGTQPHAPHPQGTQPHAPHPQGTQPKAPRRRTPRAPSNPV